MKESLCFDDVLLIPQYSNIESRTQIDLSVEFPNSRKLKFPIISSPMDTVTEEKMAIAMALNGGLGIIHRYNTIDEQAKLVSLAISASGGPVGAAVGVTGDYLQRAMALKESLVSVICIDVAHGHHVLVKQALQSLRAMVGSDMHIMAGNVATLEGFNDLADWGADSIRVGIGGGSICSTRIQTGHGIPVLQSIIDCATSDRHALLIADGGMRNSGDVVKALAAGADCVMLGSMLAGTNEAPGDINTTKDGYKCKVCRGMSSAEAQLEWRGHSNSAEGVTTTIPIKGSLNSIFTSITARIRSGLSYSGVSSIPELRANAQFIRQSNAGTTESSTHILDMSAS